LFEYKKKMNQSFESDFDFIFDEDYEFSRNLIDFIDEIY
jgi:hypothetical protein